MNRIANINALRAAAVQGNIDNLYAVIQADPSILADIDSAQFVETPLHIAALEGHLPFAIEVMNLKPSFALKLNPEGFSPIHLAMKVQQNLDRQVRENRRKMVFSFVVKNKELVKVKGRGGLTPLRLASEIEDVHFLAKFLTVCPDSIEDVTVRGETALHIAVRNDKYDSLNLLVCFLKKNRESGARKLEYKILNWKDGDGKTTLHISRLNNQQQVTSCSFHIDVVSCCNGS
jgi:ankyrin repeat protein